MKQRLLEELSITQKQADSRFIRLTLNVGKAPEGRATFQDVPRPNRPSFIAPNAVTITAKGPRKKYPSLGRCLYCQTTELRPGSGLPLSAEHIVAEGLGGTLILPEASCESCAKLTCTIEGSILRTVLLAPRRKLRIRSKRKAAKDDPIPVTFIRDGKEITTEVKISGHPTVLVLNRLSPPRLISWGRGGHVGFWAHGLGYLRDIKSGTAIPTPIFDTLRFCQMLAKIAHCFAVAELRDRIEPFLPRYILHEFVGTDVNLDGYEWVGGSDANCSPDKAMHTLGWEIVTFGSERYVVISIRLFGNLESPIYRVVVGRSLEDEPASQQERS